MAESVERLLVRIDATTEQLRRELKAADAAVAAHASVVEKAQARMGAAWQGANKFVNQHQTELKLLGAAAVSSLALAVKGIISYSDSYKNLQGQLKLVTDSEEELQRVYAANLALAKETGASLDSTVNLYARITRATEELGLSEQERLRITESINKAMIVSGASTQEAEAAIRQLSQGMASGVLRGEELNSVMENSPRLAKALADGLGVPIGALREMGSQGELTSEKITSALLKMGDEIDAEFSKMPMTVERAMNSIQVSISDAIGKADLSPLVDGIKEFEEVVSDPDIVAGLTNIASGLVKLAADAAQAIATLGGMAQALGEFAASLSAGPDPSRMLELADAIDFASKKLEFLEAIGAKNSDGAKALRAEIEKLTTVYDLQAELLDAGTKQKTKDAAATKEQVKATSQLAPIIVTATKRTTEHGKALTVVSKAQSAAAKEQERAAEAMRKANQEIEDYLVSLDEEIQMMWETKREQEILTALRQKGAQATDEQREAIRAKVGALYDEREALKSVDAALDAMFEAEKQAGKAAEEAAGATSAAWGEARDTLSEFFFKFASDGVGAFDTIVESFKAMIAKMIAEAAANQIILGVASAFPSLGIGGATGGAGGIGGALGLTGSIGGLYTKAGGMLSDLGFESIGGMFDKKGASVAGPGGGWKIGADVVGGLAGGYLGNKVFGETSGIGATLGGFAGSALIPIPGVGAAVGSFAGSALESLFGGKNDGNNTGYAKFDLGTGAVSSGGYGKTFDPANVATAERLTKQLQAMADQMGGSTFAGQVDVTASGIKFDNKQYGQDVDKFLADAFIKISAAATNLDEDLKGAIESFEGTSEEAIAFADSMVSLNGMLSNNPVQTAIDEFTASQDRAGNTLVGVYQRQLGVISELVKGYDGSATATIALNAAMVENKNTAYQLALTIQTVSESISAMFEQSAQQIRESVMTQEQRVAAWTATRAELTAGLDDIFDPAEIEQTAKEIDRLNSLIFNSLSQEQQKVQAEAFAQYAEQTNQIAQTQLTAVLESARLSQESLNAQMATIMQSAGTDMRLSADTFLAAATIISAAADRFQSAPQLGEVA